MASKWDVDTKKRTVQPLTHVPLSNPPPLREPTSQHFTTSEVIIMIIIIRGREKRKRKIGGKGSMTLPACPRCLRDACKHVRPYGSLSY